MYFSNQTSYDTLSFVWHDLMSSEERSLFYLECYQHRSFIIFKIFMIVPSYEAIYLLMAHRVGVMDTDYSFNSLLSLFRGINNDVVPLFRMFSENVLKLLL